MQELVASHNFSGTFLWVKAPSKGGKDRGVVGTAGATMCRLSMFDVFSQNPDTVKMATK